MGPFFFWVERQAARRRLGQIIRMRFQGSPGARDMGWIAQVRHRGRRTRPCARATHARTKAVACHRRFAGSNERQRYLHSYRSFPEDAAGVCAHKDSAVNCAVHHSGRSTRGRERAGWCRKNMSIPNPDANPASCIATVRSRGKGVVAKIRTCATLWPSRHRDSAVTMEKEHTALVKRIASGICNPR